MSLDDSPNIRRKRGGGEAWTRKHGTFHNIVGVAVGRSLPSTMLKVSKPFYVWLSSTRALGLTLKVWNNNLLPEKRVFVVCANPLAKPQRFPRGCYVIYTVNFRGLPSVQRIVLSDLLLEKTGSSFWQRSHHNGQRL